MKLLIAVGGGGHFSPALAVIDQLPKDWEILIVGRKYAFEGDSALSLEYTTATRLKIPFIALTTGRLQRTFTQRTLTSLIKIPIGGVQSLRILRSFKPDVVLSFGGYVSVPVASAAKLLRIPVVVHEQTLHAGLANKVISKFADKICISWKQSETYFPKEKTILTGNPLRTVFRNNIPTLQSSSPAKFPTLYITGGSGGAHGINILVEGCLKNLLEKFYVIHQTGDAQLYKDFERLENCKAKLPPELQKRYMLKKFIDPEDVVHTMAAADLVVSRSGINTVTELLYLGKPCLLIPLPVGQHDEQRANALFVERVGIGKMYDQKSLTPEILCMAIEEMIIHKDYFTKQAAESKKLIPKDAAEKIITVLQDVYQKNS